MDLDENTNVLDEVEILFKKLESLPESLKRAAFNKIQQKLPVQEKQIKTGTSGSEQKKRPGRKRKIQNDIGFEEKDAGNLWSSDNSESEYVVEDVLTSRGRKAKRISYAFMHEYGKNSEEIYDKQKEVRDEINREKKEVEMKEDSESSLTGSREDETEVLMVDNTISSGAVPVENENSEFVDDPVAGLEESQVTLSCSDDINKEQNIIIHTANDVKQTKTKNVVISGSHATSGSAFWKKRKVPRIGSLACQDCNFVTSSKSLLDVHSRRHTGIKPYVCPDCGKAFPQSSGLNVHMKRHRGQRDYPCDYCDYRAYTKVDKLRHMTIHTGERNQVCQYCGKAFAKDSTLREHVRSIHERPFKHICSECGFTTYRANNLRVHVRMRHRGEYNNHVCPVCGARVKQRNAFLEHMRAHTGEKPFRCDQCDSSFACLARLTVHRKSVHEPRQFPCSECRKTFQTKHHLIRHSVIHTKEKPYTCPFCTYSCNTQGNMTKHVKTIHHMPHFSYRKYKAEQESESSMNPEWVEKGHKVTEEYLKDLSNKLGREITLDELRARETEKQKRINEEAEQAKIRRMNRIHTPEHSYHSRLGKIVSLNSKSDSIKIEGEEIVDPATLILQVAAQNADNFTESVNAEDLTSPSQIVQVDLLSGINDETAKGDTSEVAPHIVQMLSNISDNSSKNNTQVIHIQTSDQLETTEVEDSGEYETVILSGGGEENNFVPGHVYEFVTGQNLRLCLNSEFIETEDGNTIQVLRQAPVNKREDIYSVEDSQQQLIEYDSSEHYTSDKSMVNEETGTVVVIINTEETRDNTE